MDVGCSSCGKEVPVGATECPSCHAGIGTVLFGKKKTLTKTFLSKAIELRNSIPWINASQVMSVVAEGQAPVPGKARPRFRIPRRPVLMKAAIAAGVIGAA